MNHLAHFYLSFHQESLLAGNYMADFALGSNYQKFQPEIQQGVLLHRFIDHFTDTHSAVKQSKARIAKTQGKYAPVVMDVLYDHLLAIHWDRYSNELLMDFAAKTYRQLERNKLLFPELLLQRFEHMKTHDWLTHYATADGIKRALAGLAKRAKYENKMEFAFDAFLHQKASLENDFHLFFPEIIEATSTFIEKLKF